MKEWLKKLLTQKEDKKKGLVERSKAATEVVELRSINSELDGLNEEIAELRSKIAELPDDPIAGGATPPVPEGRGAQGAVAAGGANPGLGTILASFGLQQTQQRQEPVDAHGTLEYRQAFMEFAKTGKVTPELRADAMTTTADVSAVIPTTIMNEVISKMTVYGQVFALVRKLNVKGGVDFPILSLKPVATWIGEAPVSDKQKVQTNTKLSFTYFGLECKVAISLLADTVTLTGFETTIIDLIVEAMVKAVDMSVIKGSGVGQPLGITLDTRVPNNQKVTLTATEMSAWDKWAKKVLAIMPLAYKGGAIFLMASGTFEGFINGMVDANGQPIGRINYGITSGPQERFAGKTVVQVEDDVIKPFDSAEDGDVVAIYCNLKNYGWNSNMEMKMFRYFDHDTNEWVDKAILIADGKLIDPNGVVIIKKKI